MTVQQINPELVNDANAKAQQALELDYQHLAMRLERSNIDIEAMTAQGSLKAAYNLDVEPILQMARLRNDGAINPIEVFRQSGYRAQCAKLRPVSSNSSSSGIV